MRQTTAKRILDIQEMLRADTTLMDEYRERHTEFLAMLLKLNEDQKSVLMDYLGVCIEIHLRMLEEAIK